MTLNYLIHFSQTYTVLQKKKYLRYFLRDIAGHCRSSVTKKVSFAKLVKIRFYGQITVFFVDSWIYWGITLFFFIPFLISFVFKYKNTSFLSMIANFISVKITKLQPKIFRSFLFFLDFFNFIDNLTLFFENSTDSDKLSSLHAELNALSIFQQKKITGFQEMSLNCC